MLTAAQRAQCRRIAEALDRHDQGPWLKAEGSLSAEARGAIWDFRQHVVAAQTKQAAAARPARVETKSPPRDLDYWASDDVEPIDDDAPDDDAPMPVCGACKGTGVDADGSECQICGGRGRIPAEDQEDENDGEDEE